MVFIPTETDIKSKFQGRLTMDGDGTKTVIGRCNKPPRETKSNSYVLNFEILENDGKTPMAPPGGKAYEATGFLNIDLADTRFSQFIFAFFPEFRTQGGNFEPHMLVGRSAMISVKYNDKREAEGYPPELRAFRYQPLTIAEGAATANASSAAQGGVPDAPF